jgi:hypothetical protein
MDHQRVADTQRMADNRGLLEGEGADVHQGRFDTHYAEAFCEETRKAFPV